MRLTIKEGTTAEEIGLDFARLLDELAAAGVEYSIIQKHTNARSPIRSYSTYKVAA
jgi:hypothetical protein